MKLTLTIKNVERLENGISTSMTLDNFGIVIGRGATVDWSLPDPQHYISSRHVEITYRSGAYTLEDKSTNGTFLNGGQERMSGPHTLVDGDVIVIGHYQILARLEGAGGQAGASAGPAQPPDWAGWQPQQAAARIDEGSWDRAPARPAISGQGPMSQNWAPPQVDAPPVSSPWNTPAAQATPASGWSSPANERAAAPSAVDVWGQLAESNVVDWARGGFGSSGADTPDPLVGLGVKSAEARDPLGLGAKVRVQPDPLGLGGEAASPPPPARPATVGGWGPTPERPAPEPAAGWGPRVDPDAPQAQPAQMTSPAAPVAAPQQAYAPAPGPAGGELMAFLMGAGLQPADIKVAGPQAMTAAGASMRRMVSGLVVMLEARARAKSQLGAQGTSLEFDGNNPLKFARAPEKAVAQLMNPPERGFMSAERAVEDAFRDLQAHQVATLTAMKGALAATLARFSPQSIRERAEQGGLMSKIVPSAREAALWRTYEHEFEGVAQGSDEAFMDVFAKEFRQAYDDASADIKRRSSS